MTPVVCASAFCLREGLLERFLALARAAGASVALDLASYEIVRAFRPKLHSLLEQGAVDCCFCNEDEASEVGSRAGVRHRSCKGKRKSLKNQKCRLKLNCSRRLRMGLLKSIFESIGMHHQAPT